MRHPISSVRQLSSIAALIACFCSLSLAQASTKHQAEASKSAKATPAKHVAPAAPVEPALTPQQLGLAEYVHVGVIPCELGAQVKLTADASTPGYFHVQHKQQSFRMAAVESATGALRLEDKKAGTVWLQLANKSMLMNQKAGQRMADECISPAQHLVAEAMKFAPAQSVLDAPVAAK